MSRKQIRARMKDDLMPLMSAIFGEMNIDAEQAAFYEGIQGKEVTLIFSGDDAFEVNDDGFWLPNGTWDAIA